MGEIIQDAGASDEFNGYNQMYKSWEEVERTLEKEGALYITEWEKKSDPWYTSARDTHTYSNLN